jgi:sulfite reductase (NADPH) hemoprotein beta-component
MGLENFKTELENRIGFALLPAQPYRFTERNDRFGWLENHQNLSFYTLFVEHGVVKPFQKELLFEVAKLGISDFRFTCNQNLILGNIATENKQKIVDLLAKYGIEEASSPLRKSSMACVALPTCPLALAEAQRYLPDLVSKIEPLTKKYNLENDEIIIRMTGCPNGCARPYLAEIAFVGTAPNEYNLMLGGDRLGTRLNKIYKKQVKEPEILAEVDFLFGEYAAKKQENETFGDFTNRVLF